MTTTLASNTNAATFSSFSSNAHKKLPKTPTTTMKRQRRVLMMMKTKAHAEEEEEKNTTTQQQQQQKEGLFSFSTNRLSMKTAVCFAASLTVATSTVVLPITGNADVFSARAEEQVEKCTKTVREKYKKREREKKRVSIYFFLFASNFRVLPALLVFCPLYVHHSPHALSFFIR